MLYKKGVKCDIAHFATKSAYILASNWMQIFKFGCNPDLTDLIFLLPCWPAKLEFIESLLQKRNTSLEVHICCENRNTDQWACSSSTTFHQSSLINIFLNTIILLPLLHLLLLRAQLRLKYKEIGQSCYCCTNT